MNLVQLIQIIRDPEKDVISEAEKLYPELDMDYADIYFNGQITAESSLLFIDNEKLSKGLEFDLNGIKYINLFPLDYLQDFYEDIADDSLSDIEISERIISYRLNDA